MKQDQRQELSAETKTALLDLDLSDRWRERLEEGIGTVESALAEDDPDALVEGLDRISMAILKRRDKLQLTTPAALLFQDVIDIAAPSESAARGAVSQSLKKKMRRALLEWWYDAWLAHLGRDQIRSYIQSPFHYPPVEDRVRSTTRNQITAYHDSAMEKLANKLDEEQEETAKEAQQLREEGKDREADRLEKQVEAYGWAIDEIENARQN